MLLLTIVRYLCYTVPILICDGVRLLCFVVVLAPGFIRFLYYYAAVARRVTFKYDTQQPQQRRSCRKSLDLYFPNDVLYRRACTEQRRRQHDALHHDGQQQQRPDSSTAFGEPTPTSSQLEENDTFAASDGPITCLVGVPTVVFASGGAWLIGYKLWGCLLARALTARGIIVVLPDYRNYPWGTVPDMVQDMDDVITWTVQNITKYGGDASKIVLVGQSAGGHLGFLALLRRAFREQTGSGSRTDDTEEGSSTLSVGSGWKATDLCGFIALSAPLNLSSMDRTFRRHGFDSNFVHRIFGGELDTYDAWRMLHRMSDEQTALLAYKLPPIHLYHGSADATVPCDGSAAFAQELQQRVRSDITWTVYEGWSHTDAILEGPMLGDERFHNDIAQAVVDWTHVVALSITTAEGTSHNKHDRLCPKILVRCAKFVMPF